MHKRIAAYVTKHFAAAGAIGLVAALNLLVAAAAFVKDVLLAGYLGTSAYADALTLAFFAPDTIGNNLFAAAIGVACVPLFAKLRARREETRLHAAIGRSFLLFSAAGLVVMVLSLLLREELLGALAGGNAQGQGVFAVTLRLYVMMLPLIALYPGVMIGSAALQTVRRFAVPAAAPIVMNLLFLLAVTVCLAWGLAPERGVYGIAASITAGAVCMFALVGGAMGKSYSWRLLFQWGVRLAQEGVPAAQCPSLPAAERPARVASGLTAPAASAAPAALLAPAAIQPENSTRASNAASSAVRRTDVKEILALFFPYVMILLVGQAVLFVERMLASGLGTGTVAALNYAFRLSQFPIWVYVLAVTSVMLPGLAKLTALGQEGELRRAMVRAFKQIALITLPTSVCLYMLREPIITVLFQRGAFDERSLLVTADILEGYSLMIVGQAAALIGLRYFLALGKLRLPLLIFAATGAATLLADWLLLPLLRARAIGYGAAFGMTLNGALMLLLVARRSVYPLSAWLWGAGRLLAANIILAAALWLCVRWWERFAAVGLERTAYLFAALSLCAALYIWLLLQMKLLQRWKRS